MSYTYEADDPDLLALGLHPAEVEMSSSGSEGEPPADYVNLSVCHMNPILEWLVKTFNSLPRPETLWDDASQSAEPNVWHFSVRHIQRAQPFPPERMLCLWLAGSNYVYMAGKLSYKGYPPIVPENQVDNNIRAAAIAPQLLRAFNNHFGANAEEAHQPWVLMTSDSEFDLAQAIRRLLEEAGVRDKVLCYIRSAAPEYAQKAERCYALYEKTVLRMLEPDPCPLEADEEGESLESPTASGSKDEDKASGSSIAQRVKHTRRTRRRSRRC
ncbi:hypothetical protein TWF281_003389 [Arthrobotrys megalospora]